MYCVIKLLPARLMATAPLYGHMCNVHVPGSHANGGWLCNCAGINHVLCLAAGSGIAPIRAAIESDELGLGKVTPHIYHTSHPHSLRQALRPCMRRRLTLHVSLSPPPAAVAYWPAVLRRADPGAPALQGEVRGLAGEGHGGHARLLARTRAAQLQRILGLHPGELANESQ